MSLNIALIIGLIAAVALTAASFIFIIPAKKRDSLPSFFKFLHDLFNFKSIMLEKIAKVFYVFLTIASVIVGILLIFGPSVLGGLGVMIAGPVVFRIFYELIMLKVIEVKNIIAINRKIK